MLKQNLNMKDQFGIKYSIQATVDYHFDANQSYSHVKYITVDGEDIQPSIDMFFQSTSSGKIFKII
ncbi:hypothetical protein [Acinetobacter sp. ANC 3813]|uniref:hypothetical protein n=1 Tax=Acinetobacter sp. ANC 3813 TaxID=1977873 RepID=UPI000A33975D|nr:hypothetical protein [Acinetobacter sp. ANC 3813]OTG89019.1 hypothetical protein B9T34_12445 [Acinetobacter sp. ANC 3813]